MITEKYFHLKKKDIAVVQYIIESHEGMASVTTIDRSFAVIKVSIMRDFISPMENVIEHIQARYSLKEIADYKLNH